MKSNIIKAFSLGLTAFALVLSSCRKNEPIVPNPDNKNGQPKETKVDEITKVRITLSNGHLHGAKDFHYVPSGGTFTYRNIYDRQEYTFVKDGDKWVLSNDAPYRDFIGYQVQQYDPKDATSAAPDYGAIIYLYNAKGEVINDQYASEANRSNYQFFFYPTEAKDFDGKSISIDTNNPTNILKYVYCDTNVWNKSANKSPKDANGNKLYYFLKSTEPIGIKGYFQWATISQFTLNVDLWYSPKGKLENGKASPFYAPNSTIKSGKQLLHMSLPINVYASKDFQDDVVSAIQADYDRRVGEATTDEEKEKVKPEALPLSKLSDEYKVLAQRIVKLLGAKDWETVSLDFYRYFKVYKHNNDPEGYF